MLRARSVTGEYEKTADQEIEATKNSPPLDPSG